VKPPEWQHRTRLGIHNRMEEVVKLTLEAARAELDATRRKLRKMQYGS
jgi:hypothetical protein